MTKKTAMTHSQRQYAMQRVDSVARDLLRKARELYPCTVFTGEDLVKLVKAGKVKLTKKNYKVSRYTDIFDIFDIGDFVGVENEKYLEADKKIDKQKEAVKDSIMLGDNEEALKAITAFETLKI